jgi:hypothetical protein
MAAAAAAKSTDPATWREVRRWYLAANKVDPYDAEPLIEYYRSFVLSGEPATKNAEAGLFQAIDFSPEAREARIYAAYAYLTEGDGKAAKAALGSIARAPHSGELAKFAVTILDQIDAGQLAAAAAKLQPFVKDPEGEIEKLDKKKKKGS